MNRSTRFFSIRYWKASFSFYHAFSLLSKGKYSEAIASFNKILTAELIHNFITYSCYKYIGISFCHLKDFDKSIVSLEKALNFKELNKKDGELFAYLGLAYDSKVNLTEAKKFYELGIKYYKKTDLTDLELVRARSKKVSDALGF